MNRPFSNAKPYIAQLKSIEQKISQNQLEAAALQLNVLAKTSSHDPRLFLLGSRLAEAAHNPDGVLLAARKAHQFGPEWPTATIHLATVLATRGEADEAMAMADQAVQQVSAPSSGATQDISEMLTMAAAVAERFKRHPKALEWLRRAEQFKPDDLTIRHRIARTLIDIGDHTDAIAILTDLLLLRPNNPTLLSDRLRAYLGAQQIDLAIQDGETLVHLEPNNEVHQFYLDIARGLTPKTQPAAVVMSLFDGYAGQFDRHLVRQLQYKLPRDVAQLIHQWHPDRKGDVLDLGCGTGLLGVYLGRIEGVLVGVDLSGKMIEQASRHQVYDRFHKVNVLDALQATPANLYHVITALDVLIYVGDLDTVIPNACRILLPGGRFVFSCEAQTEGDADYTLQSTRRYAHRKGYVQGLLEQAGFEEVEIEDRVLRMEHSQPVQGFLVTARKQKLETEKTALKSPKNAKPAGLRQSPVPTRQRPGKIDL